MSARYAGFAPLLALALRRDRLRLPAWLAGIALLGCYMAVAVRTAYPSQDDLRTIAGFLRGPAGTVMTGPGFGLAEPTHGSVFAAVYTLYLYLAAALMAALLVARHTRAEEESGRLELVWAGAVGRSTPLAVAGVLLAGASAAQGLACALLVWPAGFGAGDTALFGASVTTVALVFGAAALVCAQLSTHARTGTGIATLAIAAAVVTRGAGDVLRAGGSWLSWFSPFAWAQQTKVFYQGRWWPLLCGLGAAAVLFALAQHLAQRRELGAGLLRPRPGRAAAGRWLAGPFTLGLRLERAALGGWALAGLVLGTLYGSLADSVRRQLAGSGNQLLLNALGGDPGRIVQGYLATCTMLNAFAALCYSLVIAHRLVAEERAGRTALVLSAAVSRARLLAGAVGLALLGALAVLLAAAAGLGLSAWAVSGQGRYVGDAFGGALLYLPALAVLVAVAALGFAAGPAWLNLAWVVAVYAMVVGYLGVVLDLPSGLIDLSPLSHIARVPLESQPVLPLVVLALLAVALAGLALARLRQRDVG